MLYGHEKTAFLELPTPLEYLPNISEDLGCNFYIKRDDLTGLGMGGNKLRKLEYLLRDAEEKGATAIVTVGGAQTNHGRLTAAVAAKYGLKCTICAVDAWPGEVSANILLDRIMGAEIMLQAPDGRPESEQLDALLRLAREKYAAEGETVYEIPMGGSNVVGMLGYYECAQEVDRQAREMGLNNARLFCGVGSLGTYMGLFVGLRDCGSALKLTGIAISPFGEYKEQRIVDYFREVRANFGFAWDARREDFDIETGYTRGGYNNPSAEVREAIYHMARREAVILDPCYTGKAYAGMRDMVKEGKIRPGETVILLHSGGQPGINTPHHRVEFERELMGGIHIL